MALLSRILARFRRPEPAKKPLTQEEWQEWMNSLAVNARFAKPGCVVTMREDRPPQEVTTH